jgi:DNA-binding transcriptional regulator YiaG
MKQQYKSEIFAVLHEDAVASYEVGAIDTARMRMYDAACLVPEASEKPILLRAAPPVRIPAFA